jgi:hypothetical protein
LSGVDFAGGAAVAALSCFAVGTGTGAGVVVLLDLLLDEAVSVTAGGELVLDALFLVLAPDMHDPISIRIRRITKQPHPVLRHPPLLSF